MIDRWSRPLSEKPESGYLASWCWISKEIMWLVYSYCRHRVPCYIFGHDPYEVDSNTGREQCQRCGLYRNGDSDEWW